MSITMDEYNKMHKNISRIIKDGKEHLDVSGVDFGSLPQILKETKEYILCRVKGFTGWCGRGSTKYYNPEFVVFEKVSKDRVVNTLGNSFSYTRETRNKIYEEVLNKYFKKKNA